MTPARWALLKAVVQQALALPPVERAQCLVAACAGDEGLRLEAQSLLEADASAGAFIETPALAREDMSGALAVLDESPTWTGRRVGPYVLVREIGHGGMGVVYLAIRSDDAYRQQVAIKVIRSAFAPSSRSTAVFSLCGSTRAGARLLSRFSPPLRRLLMCSSSQRSPALILRPVR